MIGNTKTGKGVERGDNMQQRATGRTRTWAAAARTEPWYMGGGKLNYVGYQGAQHLAFLISAHKTIKMWAPFEKHKHS